MIQAATVKKRTALSDSAATASTSAPRKHAITEVPLSDRSVAIAVTTMSAAMPARRDALVGSAAVNSRPGTSKSTTLITLRLSTNAEISVTSPCSIFIFLGVSWKTCTMWLLMKRMTDS